MAKKDKAVPAPAVKDKESKVRFFRHNRRGAMRFLSAQHDNDATKNEYHRFTPVRVPFEDGSGNRVMGFIKVTDETLLDNKTSLAETLANMPFVDEIDSKEFDKAVSGKLRS